MELYDAAFLPDPETQVTGSAEIDWIEDGAALRLRQGDSERPSAAVWIVGRDQSESGYSVLYADSRGVSRVYHMSLEGSHWQMWRATTSSRARTYDRSDGSLTQRSDVARLTARLRCAYA